MTHSNDAAGDRDVMLQGTDTVHEAGKAGVLDAVGIQLDQAHR